LWKKTKGASKSTDRFEGVGEFYSYWAEFTSQRSFAWADKWNLNDAENRQVRRAMDGINKGERKEKKKEYSDAVRKLVTWIKKRDPRYVAFTLLQAKEETARRQALEERKAAEEEKKAARREAARIEEERRWAEREQERIDAGEELTESEEEEVEVFFCEPCGKKFKSKNAFESHLRSKKHKEMIKKIQKQMLEEDKAAGGLAKK
jgi:DnaJ family protein A protein 5